MVTVRDLTEYAFNKNDSCSNNNAQGLRECANKTQPCIDQFRVATQHCLTWPSRPTPWHCRALPASPAAGSARRPHALRCQKRSALRRCPACRAAEACAGQDELRAQQHPKGSSLRAGAAHIMQLSCLRVVALLGRYLMDIFLNQAFTCCPKPPTDMALTLSWQCACQK